MSKEVTEVKVVTQEQIDQWKKENPVDGVFRITTEDKKEVYIKGPDRPTLSYALTLSQTDPLAMVETILDSCWLGGDESVKERTGYHIGIIPQMDSILEVKAVQVEKL